MHVRVVFVAFALAGCNQPIERTVAERPKATPVRPMLLSDDNRDSHPGPSLRVSRNGQALWNGVETSDATLQADLTRYAGVRPTADPLERLYVSIQPETPAARADRIRQMVIDSGLCRQKRCIEIGWTLKGPIID